MKRNEMKYRSLTEYYRYHEIMSAPDDIEAGTAGRMSANVPPEPEVGKGFRKPVPETTFVERVAGGVAALAIVTVLIAMIGEQSIIVILGCILSAIVAPYAYYQQTLLTDIRTLKETKRAFQSEVNRLEDSNKRLAGDIEYMTESVNRLEEIDTALQVITNSQGQSVETFRKQVEESKTILKQITQSNHKATVLQNLLTVIFRSDGSG
jgi:Asp-tRNA(Asn)/Glu-tRNA(Gln) amidotransferase C subunit